MEKYLSNKIKNISLIMTILVVFLHSFNIEEVQGLNINSFIQQYVSRGICIIAVPMFFIISGYLFFYNFESTIKNWIYKYKSRFKSLVIPFIIWTVGWMVILFIIQMHPVGKSLFSNMVLSEFGIEEIIKYTFKYPIAFQLWYLSALIKCVIISPIIYIVIKKTNKYSGLAILIIWFLNILDFPVTLFSLGAYFGIYNISLKIKISTLKIKLLLVIFAMLVGINTINYNENLFILRNLIILVGVLLVWCSYDEYYYWTNEELKLAKYSILIYFFHEPLQTIINRVFFYIIGVNNYSQLIMYIVTPIITIYICIAADIFLRKYLKSVRNILIGGR